jgi:excisionase family DNA binding protein
LLPIYVAHKTGQHQSEKMLHTATRCNNQLQQATMSSNIRIEKTCEVCGVKYIAKKTITRSCSLNCARLLYKRTKRNEKIEAAIRKETIVKPFNPTISQKEFLTINEACQLINASRWTIYRLIDKGQLKAGKVGRNTRIPRTAINELFKLTEV